MHLKKKIILKLESDCYFIYGGWCWHHELPHSNISVRVVHYMSDEYTRLLIWKNNRDGHIWIRSPFGEDEGNRGKRIFSIFALSFHLKFEMKIFLVGSTYFFTFIFHPLYYHLNCQINEISFHPQFSTE